MKILTMNNLKQGTYDMDKDALLKEIEDLIKNKPEPKEVRKKDFYTLKEVEYPFGKKKVYEKKEDCPYEELQASRGHSFDKELSALESVLKVLEETISINDEHRVVTMHQISINNFSADLFNNPRCCFLDKDLSRKFDFDNIENFVELGFRSPRLLKYAKETIRIPNVSGCDVVRLNALIGQYLNYDTYQADLNSKNLKLDFDKNSLICAYHVFEHLTDPLEALKKVYDAMEEGSHFDIEVPIETHIAHSGLPLLEKNAHLFCFAENDLKNMLQLAGFKLLYGEKRTLVKSAKHSYVIGDTSDPEKLEMIKKYNEHLQSNIEELTFVPKEMTDILARDPKKGPPYASTVKHLLNEHRGHNRWLSEVFLADPNNPMVDPVFKDIENQSLFTVLEMVPVHERWLVTK